MAFDRFVKTTRTVFCVHFLYISSRTKSTEQFCRYACSMQYNLEFNRTFDTKIRFPQTPALSFTLLKGCHTEPFDALVVSTDHKPISNLFGLWLIQFFAGIWQTKIPLLFKFIMFWCMFYCFTHRDKFQIELSKKTLDFKTRTARSYP